MCKKPNFVCLSIICYFSAVLKCLLYYKVVPFRKYGHIYETTSYSQYCHTLQQWTGMPQQEGDRTTKSKRIETTIDFTDIHKNSSPFEEVPPHKKEQGKFSAQ